MNAEAPCSLSDPTIPVAERQLAILGELVQMGLALSRAHAAASLAAAHAVEVILADEYWQPETGRARALAGSKDAAEAHRKVVRSLRLTMVLEMKTAETLRDLRVGIITNSKACHQETGGTPAAPAGAVDLDRRRSAGSSSDADALDFDKPERDFEHLVEFDRPDRLPRGAFREVVGELCADLGVAPDWANWRVGRPKLEPRPLEPRPPGGSDADDRDGGVSTSSPEPVGRPASVGLGRQPFEDGNEVGGRRAAQGPPIHVAGSPHP